MTDTSGAPFGSNVRLVILLIHAHAGAPYSSRAHGHGRKEAHRLGSGRPPQRPRPRTGREARRAAGSAADPGDLLELARAVRRDGHADRAREATPHRDAG